MRGGGGGVSKVQHTRNIQREFTPNVCLQLSLVRGTELVKENFVRLENLRVRMYLCVNCIIKIKSLLGDGEWVLLSKSVLSKWNLWQPGKLSIALLSNAAASEMRLVWN